MPKFASAVTLVVLVLVSGLSSAAAATYRCKEGGKIVFSDRVCGDDAEVINVKPASGEGRATAPAAAPPENAGSSRRYKARKTPRAPY